jgi:iron-sulfur cluster repair protein YtfE (RIC family)
VSTTPPFALRTRTAREPQPDLTPIVVVHRAIRQDLARLVACLGEVAARDWPPSRARAIRRYTAALLAEILAHHRGEDDIIWPVIAATAGQAVDLTPLTDDHQAIGAAARRVNQAVACFRAEPAASARLHASVSVLRDMLEEHIADEEEQIFPAMRRYLPAEAYRWCQRQVQRQAPWPGRRFTAPWLARYAQPDELSRLRAAGGRPARILLAANRPGYARLERRAFGASRAAPDHPHAPDHTFRSPRGATMFQSHPVRRRLTATLPATLAAVTVGLLATFASIPAAFASQVPLATVHHATNSGLATWQIAMIGVGVPVVLTAVGILAKRIRSAQRAAAAPTA